MATLSKLALQPAGTTGDGLGILVSATATPGTAIHTAGSIATTIDEIWLYAYNHDTASLNLTIEFGGVTSPKDVILSAIAAQSGLVLICAGLIIQGNASPKIVRAFASSANKISIFGYVNRITA
jgi:hypothetical protein